MLAVIFEMMIIDINSYYSSNASRSSHKTGISRATQGNEGSNVSQVNFPNN